MQNDRLAWPTLLLLLTVLVPTLGVVWMMREAVRNERLATSQRLREAYQAQLESASQAVQDLWGARCEQLTQQTDEQTPPQRFAEIVSQRLFDSALICDAQGQVLYPDPLASVEAASIDFGPAWNRAERSEFAEQDFAVAAVAYAEIVGEATESVVRARARQAQVRCLLKLGERDAAIRVLEAQRQQEGDRDEQGRSFSAAAELRLLELLEPTSQSWDAVAAQLTRRLRDYQDAALTSSQRRFLMNELQRLSNDSVDFLTQDAESLAAEVVAVDESSLASRSVQSTSIAGLWSQATPDGRVIGLLRTATVRSELLKLSEGLPLSSGVKFAVTLPEEAGRNLMDIPLGENLGPWRLSLAETDGDPFDESSPQRWAMHVWIAMLVVVATFVMAWLLAAALRRRLRLAQLKNDLVATVSHELKTPLASIRLLVDTLLEAENHPTGEMPVAQVREYLEMIAHENARLTRLIDNFLTFSRMERGMQRFNFQVIDVREAVHQAASVFREHLGDVDSCLRVDAGEPAYVSADLDALVTAVVNLLENAWKYSDGEKQIVLTALPKGDRVQVAVRDNGIGLSARAAARVFDRFYQVDQRVARTQGGCGLGLSIVNVIAESHHGEVRVESRPGVGSTFTLCLPRQRAENANSSQPIEQESQS